MQLLHFLFIRPAWQTCHGVNSKIDQSLPRGNSNLFIEIDTLLLNFREELLVA